MRCLHSNMMRTSLENLDASHAGRARNEHKRASALGVASPRSSAPHQRRQPLVHTRETSPRRARLESTENMRPKPKYIRLPNLAGLGLAKLGVGGWTAPASCSATKPKLLENHDSGAPSFDDLRVTPTQQGVAPGSKVVPALPPNPGRLWSPIGGSGTAKCTRRTPITPPPCTDARGSRTAGRCRSRQ